jgi:hypothetical protein
MEVIKMVKLHSVETFVKDPVDVWGREQTIGLSEHAARMGSPMIYDRRGTVFAYDEFETSPLKWSKTNSGGAGTGQIVSLSNSINAYRGEMCMEMVAPNVADDYVSASRIFGGVSKHRIGVELTTVLGSASHPKIALGISIFTGTRRIMAGIRLQPHTNNGLSYFHTGTDMSADAGYVSFDTSFVLKMSTPYPLKFVVDVDKEKYSRCMFGSSEIDMSSYVPAVANSTYAPHVICSVFAINDSGHEPGYWCDNFILTIEEPK